MALPRDRSVTSSPPSAFGQYRVVHQVGAGVLGPVFRAYDPEHDRAVAIKAFSLDLTPEQARDLAADLARLPTLALGHPSMIAPLGAGADGSTAYLVEEYFVAESADVALKQYGPAPVPDAMRVVGQLAGALDVAAAALVHHGALHPRDILLAQHEVRLTGLGVVAALERVGFRTAARRPYAAPERLSGGPFGAAADIFSLACVSYELVTGRRPTLSGETVSVDTDSVQAADAGALAETFARALSLRPDDRHPSALSFAAALKHALTGEPLQTPAEFERPRSRRGAKGGHKAPILSLDADRAEVADPASPASDALAAQIAPEVRVADEPGVLPDDLPLAPPLGTPSTDDVRAAMQQYEAPAERTPALQPADEVGHTPLPSFLEAYRIAAAEESEPTLAVPMPPKVEVPEAEPPTALEPDFSDSDRRIEPTMAIPLAVFFRTPASAPRFTPAEPALPELLEPTTSDVPTDELPSPERPLPELPEPEAPVVEPAVGPLRLDELDFVRPSFAPAKPHREQAPMFASVSPPPDSSDAKPRIARVPMLGMLLVGMLLGFLAGYLVAPRHESAPPTSATVALRASPAPGLESQPGGTPRVTHAIGTPAQAAASSAAGEHAVQPRTSHPAGGTSEVTGSATPVKPEKLTARERRALRLEAQRDAVRAAAGARKANPARTGTSVEGSLLIVSKPPGAAVTLDGNPAGKTPLTLPTVTAGSHAIKLDLAGYNVWSTAIQVSAGQQGRVTASLERRSGEGRSMER